MASWWPTCGQHKGDGAQTKAIHGDIGHEGKDGAVRGPGDCQKEPQCHDQHCLAHSTQHHGGEQQHPSSAVSCGGTGKSGTLSFIKINVSIYVSKALPPHGTPSKGVATAGIPPAFPALALPLIKGTQSLIYQLFLSIKLCHD